MSKDKVSNATPWNSFLGETKQQVNFYRWVTIISVMVSLIAVSACVWFSSQVKYVPFVLQVNKDYAPLQVHMLESLSKTKEAVTRTALANMIKNMRVIYGGDEIAQKDAIKQVYYYIKQGTQPYVYIKDMYEKDKPSEKNFINSVEIRSVLPLTNDTWRAEWVEKQAFKDGNVGAPRSYSAIIQVEYASTITDSMIITNPTGLYLKNIQVTEDYK